MIFNFLNRKVIFTVLFLNLCSYSNYGIYSEKKDNFSSLRYPFATVLKKGNSVSYQYNYLNEIGSEHFAALTSDIKNNNFSFIYKYSTLKNQLIHSSLSTEFSNFTAGASFNFHIIDSELLFTVNIGTGYIFNNNLYTGIFIENLGLTDGSVFLFPFSPGLVILGSIPVIKKFDYSLKGSYNRNVSSSDIHGFSVIGEIRKKFFEESGFSISLEDSIAKNSAGKIVNSTSGEICFDIYKTKSMFSIFGGLTYNFDFKNFNFNSGISITSKQKKSDDELKSVIEYNYTNDSLSVLIGITGNFNEVTIPIKRWTLFVFYEDKKRNKNIKTFSGGNIPPKTILWDFRDNSGQLVEKNDYKIKLVVIDELKRTSISNTVTISHFD